MKLVIPVSLPSTLKKPSQDISKFSILLAGDKTTGKSSFTAQYPGHFILGGEIGNLDHIEGNWEYIHSWDEFVEYNDKLEENPTYCKTLGIDGVNKFDYYAYLQARKLLKKEEIEKDDYDVWGLKRKLLNKQLERLRKLPFNMVYTCHTEFKTLTDKKGREISKLEPNLSNQLREIFDEMPTGVFGLMYRERDNQIYMQIIGDTFVTASHKFIDHFRWNGYQIRSIPLGFSPEQGFKNFNLAFNNQLQVADEHLIKTSPQVIVSQPPKLVLKGSSGL